MSLCCVDDSHGGQRIDYIAQGHPVVEIGPLLRAQRSGATALIEHLTHLVFAFVAIIGFIIVSVSTAPA